MRVSKLEEWDFNGFTRCTLELAFGKAWQHQASRV